jgi:hypothetical protein
MLINPTAPTKNKKSFVYNIPHVVSARIHVAEANNTAISMSNTSTPTFHYMMLPITRNSSHCKKKIYVINIR